MGPVPEKVRRLPKFGEWDVNDPASAEGFTVIFNKARDEKKTGGKPESPGKVDPNIRHGGVDPGTGRPSKNGFAAFINHQQSFDNVVLLSALMEEHAGEMKFEAMVSSLPKEIVRDILLRLPAKALIRCTSVSKRWNCMVRSPSFIRTHLSCTIDFNQFGTHQLLLQSVRGDNPVEQNCYLHYDNHAFDEYCKLEYPSVPKRNRFLRVAFVNGAVHWQACRHLNDGRYQNFILAFDVDSELFHEIKVPKSFRQGDIPLDYHLSVSGDGNSIAMFTTMHGRNST
ncbi:hypothetical protein C1H46_029404 [Malus baccata]|uniref:F-box domain-containing protein n=1 Tax=Malus baccata TaxID=106549 RepID=A0A540LEW1_MALBA|nr:hypothetical protein C1H46_029404 [Malus baccata]